MLALLRVVPGTTGRLYADCHNLFPAAASIDGVLHHRDKPLPFPPAPGSIPRAAAGRLAVPRSVPGAPGRILVCSPEAQNAVPLLYFADLLVPCSDLQVFPCDL